VTLAFRSITKRKSIAHHSCPKQRELKKKQALL
jgi:hypothetical protein